MQKVGSALVVVQDSCRTRPAEPEEAPLATAALGSEAGSRALLAQLDSLQAQVTIHAQCFPSTVVLSFATYTICAESLGGWWHKPGRCGRLLAQKLA